uniref:hypothetical protein n=1 Tax=Ningiella ruwaisensis TaxID=2364274 RepID=UPI00109F8E3B|nr:hypothetical protein [Ningiella ruwaisensis]
MRTVLSISFLLLLLLSPTSKAVLINAGDTAFLAGTTSAANPDLDGTVILNNSASDVLFLLEPALFIAGSVRNRVVRSTNTGNLIFMPRFENPVNVTASNFLIDSVEFFGFGDFMTDIDYRVDGLGDRGPNQATRSADGDLLSFDFLFPLVIGNLVGEPQETSRFFSIETDATDYSLDGRILVHGRHPDFASGTFTLSFDNIAVPTFSSVDGPSHIAIFLGLILLIYTLKKERDEQAYYRQQRGSLIDCGG